MKTSIIILTKNAGSNFKELLERIHSQTITDFEILVIDSGSSDSTIAFAEESGARIRCIAPEDFHHSATRNLGAELAKGEYLVYITQDALPVNDTWLENLLSPFEDGKVAGVYGRQIAFNDANPIEKFFYSYFYPDKQIKLTRNSLCEPLGDFYVENAFLSDVNSAMRKKVWSKIKFNENIIMAEEKKWAVDILNADYELVYKPEAAVNHSHSYPITTIFKRRFDDGVAIKQIYGNKSSTSRKTLTMSINYFSGQMKYLAKNSPIYIPYSIIYTLFVFSAISLGKKEDLIPLAVKRKISKHEMWWLKDAQ